MNEIRCDPLSGHRVLIAEGRSARPHDYKTSHVVGSRSVCPFCAGNERETPEEVLRAGDTGRWQVRVVRNKYPALSLSRQADPDMASLSQTSLSLAEEVPTVAGEGIHEVIIESPDHHVRTTELGVAHLTIVLQTTKKRLEQIREFPTLQSVQVFKNVGPAGGATIEHAHSQLIALPIVPPSLCREQTVMTGHLQRTGHCLLCDLQDRERKEGQRMIAENASFVAFCAYAGRQPGETWILPKKHQADFIASSESDCELLAEILYQVLTQLDTALEMPAYNYMIQSAPLEGDSMDHYHWRLVILPRITIQAGFEWGSGCFINPIAPERIAESMRRQVSVENIPVKQQTPCASR